MLTTAQLNPALADESLDSINFLNEVTLRYPQATSFGAGRPFDGLFAVDEALLLIKRFVDHQARETGQSAEAVMTMLGQYGRTKGIIHHLIAQLLRNDEGLAVDPESVLVTAGCQEALALCAAVLCSGPDDVAVVCEPGYVGFTGIAKVLGVPLQGVPAADGAVDPARLRQTLAQLGARGKRPRLLYCCPDFANPTGARMSRATRESILEICAEHDILIFEDATYRYFPFDGPPIESLKQLDTTSQVLHCGTFAKTLFPGLRVAYLVADQQVSQGHSTRLLADELSKAKSMVTNNTSPICQAIAGGYLLEHGCSLKRATLPKLDFYRNNRDVLAKALDEHFPATQSWTRDVDWHIPDGGFFATLRVPFEADYEALHESAADHRVIWVPMREFYLGAGGEREIRLSFSYLEPGRIATGIERLAGFVRSRIDRDRGLVSAESSGERS